MRPQHIPRNRTTATAQGEVHLGALIYAISPRSHHRTLLSYGRELPRPIASLSPMLSSPGIKFHCEKYTAALPMTLHAAVNRAPARDGNATATPVGRSGPSDGWPLTQPHMVRRRDPASGNITRVHDGLQMAYVWSSTPNDWGEGAPTSVARTAPDNEALGCSPRLGESLLPAAAHSRCLSPSRITGLSLQVDPHRVSLLAEPHTLQRSHLSQRPQAPRLTSAPIKSESLTTLLTDHLGAWLAVSMEPRLRSTCQQPRCPPQQRLRQRLAGSVASSL